MRKNCKDCKYFRITSKKVVRCLRRREISDKHSKACKLWKSKIKLIIDRCFANPTYHCLQEAPPNGLRNLHPGEEIWVIGTGPSLDNVPKDFFDDNCYFNSPVHYLPNLSDEYWLSFLRSKHHVYLMTGTGENEKD